MTNREVLCGLGAWRPGFLQPLASKKVYMFLYGCLGIIQGMFFTYLSATLSTMERQFGIKSKEAAYLMSGNEFSQILFVFAMPFIVKVKKRPFWTAMGLGCTALGCFMMAMPHWVKSQNAVEANALSTSASGHNFSMTSMYSSMEKFCQTAGPDINDACDEDGNRKVDWAGLVVIFIGILLTGIGNCAFYSFGVAYLDDNTSHENSPIMLSLIYTFRLLGPTLGFLLGSFCLRTYVYPGSQVDIEEGDPGWIGAWWLGFPIIGSLIILFALPLILFPERLPKMNTDAAKRNKMETEKMMADEADGKPKPGKDNDPPAKESFKEAFKRLLTNKIFMFNFGSSLFYVFAFMGFGTFMPKYMEYVFKMKGSTSSSFAGGVGTISKAIGLLISGWAISRWKPSARFLSGWNVVLGFMFFASLIVFSMLGCPSSQMYHTESSCNQNCECTLESRISPICSKDGVTNFYSPCLAGCKSMTYDKATKTKIYHDCACVAESWTSLNATLSDEWVKKGPLKDWSHPSLSVIEKAKQSSRSFNDEAVGGWCEIDCTKIFQTFGIVMFLLMVLASTGRIGNVLVALRCIDVRDKSLSMAFNVVFLSLLAMLPAPMVYGSIIDSTCTLWQRECGEFTNCMLYDNDALRSTLMSTTAGIMIFGVLFDVAVWYYAKDVVLFDKGQKNAKNEAASSAEQQKETELNGGLQSEFDAEKFDIPLPTVN